MLVQMLSTVPDDTADDEILDHCSRRVCELRRGVTGEPSTEPRGDPDDGESGLVSGGAGGGGGGGAGGADGGRHKGTVSCGPNTTIDGLINVAVSDTPAPETAPSRPDDVTGSWSSSTSRADIATRRRHLTVHDSDDNLQ